MNLAIPRTWDLSGVYPMGSHPTATFLGEDVLGRDANCPPGCCGGGGTLCVCDVGACFCERYRQQFTAAGFTGVYTVLNGTKVTVFQLCVESPPGEFTWKHLYEDASAKVELEQLKDTFTFGTYYQVRYTYKPASQSAVYLGYWEPPFCGDTPCSSGASVNLPLVNSSIPGAPAQIAYQPLNTSTHITCVCFFEIPFNLAISITGTCPELNGSKTLAFSWLAVMGSQPRVWFWQGVNYAFEFRIHPATDLTNAATLTLYKWNGSVWVFAGSSVVPRSGNWSCSPFMFTGPSIQIGTGFQTANCPIGAIINWVITTVP